MMRAIPLHRAMDANGHLAEVLDRPVHALEVLVPVDEGDAAQGLIQKLVLSSRHSFSRDTTNTASRSPTDIP